MKFNTFATFKVNKASEKKYFPKKKNGKLFGEKCSHNVDVIFMQQSTQNTYIGGRLSTRFFLFRSLRSALFAS